MCSDFIAELGQIPEEAVVRSMQFEISKPGVGTANREGWTLLELRSNAVKSCKEFGILSVPCLELGSSPC